MKPNQESKRVMGFWLVALSVGLQSLSEYTFMRFPTIGGQEAHDAVFVVGIATLLAGFGHAAARPLLKKLLQPQS